MSHRREPEPFTFYLGRLAMVVGLLIFAIVAIVLSLVVAGALFIYVVEHGFLD